MFSQLLPRSLDNRYGGHRLALWIFGLVVAVRIGQSLAAAQTIQAVWPAIPLMFAVLVVEWLSRQLVLHFIPLIRTGHPPGPVVHLILFLLTLLGLGLALWNRDNRQGRAVRSEP